MSSYNGSASDFSSTDSDAWRQLVDGCMASWQGSSAHFGLLIDQEYHTESIGIGVAVRESNTGVDVMICCIMADF